jgi:hypothetical protein
MLALLFSKQNRSRCVPENLRRKLRYDFIENGVKSVSLS